MKDNDQITTANVHEAIFKALGQYSKKNMFVDLMFWREACRLLIERTKEKFKTNAKHNLKAFLKEKNVRYFTLEEVFQILEETEPE